MVERREVFEEAILLFERKKAGIPLPWEIKRVMREVFPLVQLDLMEYYRRSAEVLEHLGEEKNLLRENTGENLSRPSLCATFLLSEISNQYMNVAKDAYEKRNTEKFRFFFDFAAGSNRVGGSILVAEHELSYRGEKERLRVESRGSILGMPASEIAEIYLGRKREADNFSKLLLEDPLGFLLVDRVVKEVEADPDLYKASQAKEYVLAGVHASRDLYKKLYRIAAPLYPEKPSK